jgi:STE24 endopeptidase
MVAHRFRLPLAAVAAVAAVAVATLLLRPRGGLIESAAVPAEAYFSPAQLERAEAFSGPQRLLGLGGLALSGATLAVLALRPPRGIRRLIGRLEQRPLLGAGAAGASIVVLLAIVTLPLGAVANERAADVGLSTQSFWSWLLDRTKSTAVGAVIAAAGALVVVGLIRRLPRAWWGPGGAVVILASVVLTYAAPVVIDPLFNRFEPLPSGELRGSVLKLAERADVDVGEVYRVDASRRTTGANAYVGGLGETKRVVLYDNLIEEVPADQVEAVVAHELAHVSYRDVPTGLLWVAIVALPATFLVQRIAERVVQRRAPRREVAMFVRARRRRPLPGTAAAVPALALAAALVAFCVQIAGNWLSRQVEARADAYALGLADDPDAFVELQRSLAIRNVSDPDPPAVLHALFGTHPTTVERIAAGAERRSASPEDGAPRRSRAGS